MRVGPLWLLSLTSLIIIAIECVEIEGRSLDRRDPFRDPADHFPRISTGVSRNARIGVQSPILERTKTWTVNSSSTLPMTLISREKIQAENLSDRRRKEERIVKNSRDSQAHQEMEKDKEDQDDDEDPFNPDKVTKIEESQPIDKDYKESGNEEDPSDYKDSNHEKDSAHETEDEEVKEEKEPSQSSPSTTVEPPFGSDESIFQVNPGVEKPLFPMLKLPPVIERDKEETEGDEEEEEEETEGEGEEDGEETTHAEEREVSVSMRTTRRLFSPSTTTRRPSSITTTSSTITPTTTTTPIPITTTQSTTSMSTDSLMESTETREETEMEGINGTEEEREETEMTTAEIERGSREGETTIGMSREQEETTQLPTRSAEVIPVSGELNGEIEESKTENGNESENLGSIEGSTEMIEKSIEETTVSLSREMMNGEMSTQTPSISSSTPSTPSTPSIPSTTTMVASRSSFSLKVLSVEFFNDFLDPESGKSRKLREQVLPPLRELFSTLLDSFVNVEVDNVERAKTGVVLNGVIYTKRSIDDPQMLATRLDELLLQRDGILGEHTIEPNSILINDVPSGSLLSMAGGVGESLPSSDTPLIVALVLLALLSIVVVSICVIIMNNRRSSGSSKINGGRGGGGGGNGRGGGGGGSGDLPSRTEQGLHAYSNPNVNLTSYATGAPGLTRHYDGSNQGPPTMDYSSMSFFQSSSSHHGPINYHQPPPPWSGGGYEAIGPSESPFAEGYRRYEPHY